MDFKVYIISDSGFPTSDWGLSAYLGFKEKGADVVLFEDIMEVPARKSNLVVADVDATHSHMIRLGGQAPLALNIPPELMKYAGREIRYMTMGEFKQDTRLPIFIKGNNLPKEYHEIFDAGVIKTEYARTNFFNGVPDDFPVLVSEYVDIVSEYRCYVIDGKIVSVNRYNIGDYHVYPDMHLVDAMLADFKSPPAGCTIDVGVTADNRTILIECQDGYSLGNYGLEPQLYATLLAKRWVELMRNIV